MGVASPHDKQGRRVFTDKPLSLSFSPSPSLSSGFSTQLMLGSTEHFWLKSSATDLEEESVRLWLSSVVAVSVKTAVTSPSSA